MAITLTKEELILVNKINNKKFLDPLDLLAFADLAYKFRERDGISKESNEKLSILNAEGFADRVELLRSQLEEEQKNNLDFKEEQFVFYKSTELELNKLKPDTQLREEEEALLAAMLRETLCSANEVFWQRQETRKQNAQIVAPTQVVAGTGTSVTYDFNPNTAITKNRELNFTNAEFKFTYISENLRGNEGKIQDLIKKTEQKVFDDFLKEKGYGTLGDLMTKDNNEPLNSQQLNDLQTEFSEYRSIDKLNTAATEVTKEAGILLKFTNAPTPVKEIKETTEHVLQKATAPTPNPLKSV